ncbi:MAG: hydroxysqualene dehydroxylase HpnE [Burkholderiaceae bacterium]|nr:hydroxysqualene dehydroxylase HpnE [Burkholderiaceae bacterium]
MPTAPIAVVGGGWSGLAAALALSDAGERVALFEAAPQLGGRARRVEFSLGERPYPLDNGQHLLIGAYRDTLALMQRVGVDPQQAFLRQPFALRYPDGFRLQATRAPAPLHLAGALLLSRGLTVAARVAMARAVQRWQRGGWHASHHESAINLMHALPRVVVDRIWQPLCVAALNVRLEEASAAVFLTVLRDSLGASRADSDLLLPRTDLSALLPDAAGAALQANGVAVRLRCAVEQITADGRGWSLVTRQGACPASRVVLALPPWRAAPLLASAQYSALDSAIGLLQDIRTAPIATVYLRYPTGQRLPFPAMALVEDPARGAFGQWAFDRGALDTRCDGLVSVVVSATGAHDALTQDALASAVAAQLSAALPLPPPQASQVIVEKRATIVPAPGLQRPPATLPVTGLYLAGDAADSAYPSTIEGSVRSGLAAARALLAAAR